MSIYEKFIELAGGKDSAKLVIVPNAGGRETYIDSIVTRSWRKRGVKHVKMLFTKDAFMAVVEDNKKRNASKN